MFQMLSIEPYNIYNTMVVYLCKDIYYFLKGLDIPDIFIKSAPEKEVQAIRKSFDQGKLILL